MIHYLKQPLLFLLLFASMLAEAECDQFFIPPIPKWSFGREKPNLQINQIIPEIYKTSIENKLGKISINMNYENANTLSFSLSTESSNGFMSWILIDEGKPEALRVEGLMVENPLNSDRARLHLTQSKSGAPVEVFRYAKNQLLELVKQAGKNKITATGAQDYTVLMLYTRLVGMSPETAEGKQSMKLLDDLYSFARKNFPDEYRPKSLNDFSLSLGDYYGFYGEEVAESLWNDYLSSGVLSPKLELLKNLDNETIAFIYKDAMEGSPRVYYLNTLVPGTPILKFHEIKKKIGGLQLDAKSSGY